MGQPTEVANNKIAIWDEKDQKFVFEEISHLEQVVNSGAGGETDWLDLKKNKIAQFQVVEESGTITDAVATLQHSIDGVTPIDTAETVTNEGVSDQVEVARFVRVKFTTNSSVASTATVSISGR